MDATNAREHEPIDDHEVVYERRSHDRGDPAATVIVTLYNYEKYIEECLNSVYLQTAVELDLIVVDDRSKDGSVDRAAAWMRSHGRRFRRVLLVRNRVNRGLARARNRAFEIATTDYVFVLDADNSIYPRCVATLTDALDRCNASFAYCYLEKFGVESGLLSDRPWDLDALKSGNYIDAMALVRRSTWRDIGGYSTDMGAMGFEDYEFWLKIAERGGYGAHVPEILARYRVHFQSMLNTETRRKESLLWDYLEQKHRGLVRPVVEPERRKYDSDRLTLVCDRSRLERAEDGSIAIDLRGRAAARFGVRRVEIHIDGKLYDIARYGDRRPDPTDPYRPSAPCGFAYRLTIDPCGPPNEVVIRAIGLSGRSVELRGRPAPIARRDDLDAWTIAFEGGIVESRGVQAVA